MNPSQERIVDYLKKDFLPLSKESTPEDSSMFEYLEGNGLMTKIRDGFLTINNEGKAFISNSNIFNPVPLSVPDWRTNIIKQLQDGEAILKGYGKLFDRALSELKDDGIVEQVGTSYLSKLTSKGRELVRSVPIEELKISILRCLFKAKTVTTILKIPNELNVDERLLQLTANELKDRGLIRNSNTGWLINPSGEDYLTRHDFGMKKEEKSTVSNTYHLPNAVGTIIGDNNQSSIIANDIITKQATHNAIPKSNSRYNKIVRGILIAAIGGIIAGIALWLIFGK